MDTQNEKVFVFPFQRGEVLTKLNKFENLRKLKEHYIRICYAIDDIEDNISRFQRPRSPREDINQRCDKNTFRVLKSQKEHVKERIHLLEEEIRKDMDNLKNEL